MYSIEGHIGALRKCRINHDQGEVELALKLRVGLLLVLQVFGILLALLVGYM